MLPDADAAALRRFAACIAGHALQLGVYGSTAWDYFAGGGYRHPQSDIDVICDVASSAGLTACLAAFADGSQLLSRRGSTARFASPAAAPSPGASSSRRAAGGPAMVLAKGERDVALVTLHCALAPLR